MKYAIVVLAGALAFGVTAPAVVAPALAQVVVPGTDKAPFRCDARAPNVCNFRIFFGPRSRDVTLVAGMKTTVPEIKLGRDTYCVALNKKPVNTCTRKLINAKINN